jgi:flavin-dependent dehydrogenase
MERARVYLSGIQADVPFGTDPDLVELHPSVSPEFFGWVIPIGNRRARVGLCGCTNVKEKFSKFIQQFGESTLHLVTGTLPLGVMPRTYGHRTLFIGDAAGFAKPTSGGGVYTGIRSARHAAAVAAACCERHRYDDTVLAGYEQRWQADIGRELALGFRLFQIRQQLSVQEIDTLCRAMNDPEVIEAIVACGDMDRPSRLVKELMKKPALFRCMGILLRSGMKALFA